MRREDRATALAFMDQPQVLRRLFSWIVEGSVAATRLSDHHAFSRGNRIRPRLSTRTPAAGDRTAGSNLNSARSTIACENRRGLYLRRAYEEGQALLPARSWSSALLATQRRAGDVAGGEADD